jgi:plastocyanin
MNTTRLTNTTGLALLILAAACGGGGGEQPPAETPAPPTAQSVPMSTSPATPDAGGKIIEIEMETDAQGNNLFRPADVTASRGDVLRYKLVSGVHNVHFVADSNPTLKPALDPSPMLQLPGQSIDVKVTWDAGRYFYQCDPHMLLGMVGHITVK